jgi:dephospho-CoA kinase
MSENGANMRRVVAIVGMAGSGKSEVANVFEQNGFFRVRFGDVTDIEIKKHNLEINETTERRFREQLRKELGMAAYAILNRPRIDEALQKSDVVADGLYSWEEYLDFKSYYLNNFYVVAVFSSPTTRYARLSERNLRPLNIEEAASRDRSEIENLNKGGPIAMAEYTILNETNLPDLRLKTENILKHLNALK